VDVDLVMCDAKLAVNRLHEITCSSSNDDTVNKEIMVFFAVNHLKKLWSFALTQAKQAGTQLNYPG